jgi:hypothetical protein
MRKNTEEVCGTSRKGGYILAEVLICTVLVASVILLGVDASGFAVKTIEKLNETLRDAVSLSSVMAEMESTDFTDPPEGREGWEVTVTKKGSVGAPSIESSAVRLSADIGRSPIRLSWTRWEIQRKQ